MLSDAILHHLTQYHRCQLFRCHSDTYKCEVNTEIMNLATLALHQT